MPEETSEQKSMDGFARSLNDIFALIDEEKRTNLALAIGNVTISWNKLHQDLSELFVAVTKMRNQNMARGIWHSQTSDFSQRRLLRAALKAPSRSFQRQRVKAAIKIVNRADQLSHRRNDAIHAHFRLEFTDGDFRYAPDVQSSSKFSQNLAGKDVIQVFKDHVRQVDSLTSKAREIRRHFLQRRI